MSVFARLKKAREEKKGFTLVELIVVLVILAILAAILVPALLGWIDKAKEKQYVLDARSIYVATQAYVDEQYAKSEASIPTEGVAIGDISEITKMADVDCTAITIIKYAARATSSTGSKAEISAIKIEGLDGYTAYLNCDSTGAAYEKDAGWVIKK